MKRILIVGATSGMGEGLARLYARQGNVKVGIAGRRRERLEALCREWPDVFCRKVCDVSREETVTACLEQLVADMGGLDVLVLSAGTGTLNPQLDAEAERRTVAVNVCGWTRVVDWAVRYFERQGYGHLVAITSVGGLRGNGVAPAYNASKAWQMNYLEGMRQRLCKSGVPVAVTDIRPGFVDTAMAQGEGLFWVVPLAKACRRIHRAIERRQRVVYVSRRWRWVAAVVRLIPGALWCRM